MRKRDELTDPSSCLNRASDDEWTFVLLGRDVAAPAAVRAWMAERVRLGKNLRTDPQILEAERWIETVLAEQRKDQPPPSPLCVCQRCGKQLFVASSGNFRLRASVWEGVCFGCLLPEED